MFGSGNACSPAGPSCWSDGYFTDHQCRDGCYIQCDCGGIYAPVDSTEVVWVCKGCDHRWFDHDSFGALNDEEVVAMVLGSTLRS
jgi:hypothetical protein